MGAELWGCLRGSHVPATPEFWLIWEEASFGINIPTPNSRLQSSICPCWAQRTNPISLLVPSNPSCQSLQVREFHSFIVLFHLMNEKLGMGSSGENPCQDKPEGWWVKKCSVVFWVFFLINGIILGVFLLGKTHQTARSKPMDLPKWRLCPWSLPAGKLISAEWKHSPYPWDAGKSILGFWGKEPEGSLSQFLALHRHPKILPCP